MEAAHTPSPRIAKPLLAWLALLPLLFIVFFPGLSAPFLLDDSTSIQNNSEIRQVTPGNILKLFRGHSNVRAFDHHPVPALSAMFDYQWAGLDPFGFHLSNLIYHWLAAGAVMLVFLAIWRIRRQQAGQDDGSPDGFWMATSLMFIWAIHPFATMQVAYITGRQEALLTLFYLFSIYAFLRGWLEVSYLCALASFLCKEVAVTLPGALFLVDWAQGNQSVFNTFRRRARYYSFLTASWLFICYYHLRGGRRNEIFTGGMPLGTTAEYFKAECGIVVGYFKKLFWPAPIEFYPYIRPVETWAEWVPALLALIAYVAIAFYCLRWSRWLTAALLFPLLVLSPTSSVLPIPFEPAMEYRMYLPAVALIGLLVTALWQIQKPQWLRFVIAIAVLIPLATVSHLRTRDYESAEKLYERDFAINPSNLNTLEALGGVYFAARRYDLSREISWRLVDVALSQNNKDHASRGYVQLARIDFALNRYPEAEDFYRRAIVINNNWKAKLNLASLHLHRNQFDEAARLIEEYLKFAPDHPDALLLYYETRMSANRIEEAERLFENFMQLYPERHDLDSQRTRILHKKRQLLEAATKP